MQRLAPRWACRRREPYLSGVPGPFDALLTPSRAMRCLQHAARSFLAVPLRCPALSHRTAPLPQSLAPAPARWVSRQSLRIVCSASGAAPSMALPSAADQAGERGEPCC